MKKLLKEITKYQKKPSKTSFYIVEGKRAVYQCIKYQKNFDFLFVTEAFLLIEQEFLKKFKDIYKIIVTDKRLFDKMASTENPQGIIGIIKKHEYNINDIIRNKNAIFILDNIRDPGNLGTIFRSALSFGFSGIILTKGTVDAYNSKAVRASLGAVSNIPFLKSENIIDDIKFLKKQGYKIIATSSYAKENIYKLKFPKKSAYIIGSEAHGISDEIMKVSDITTKIPLKNMESLNAAITASIIAYNHNKI